MANNPVLLFSFDFLHLMATIVWIGGLMFNVLVVMPSVSKTLDPAQKGKLMGVMFRRVRVLVYVSLLVLFVTGIPMKIASEYYVAIINFDTNWETVSFIKHVLVAMMALSAFYSFEILLPSLKKLASQGASTKIVSLQKQQAVLARVTFLLGIVVVFLSAMMKYL